jgi:hypothetical protein
VNYKIRKNQHITAMTESLKKAIEDHQDIVRVKNHLAHLVSKIQEEEDSLKELGNVLEKEHQDVKRLEKLSVKGIFHEFLGDKKKQLGIERQEYLDVVLRYNEAVKYIELLEFEKEVLEEKLTKEKEVKETLNKLLKERAHQLMRTNSAIGNELLQIEKQIDQKLAMKREIHEALIVGTSIMSKLNIIIKLLGKNEAWGYTGDRYLTGIDRHHASKNIDKALRTGYEVKQLLLQYEDELKDIYGDRRFRLAATMNTILNFTANFRGNLIADWIVSEKIHHTFHNTVGFRDQIQRINTSLTQELSNTDTAMEYLDKKKKEIVMDS